MLKITLVKSVIGNTPANRATVRALGLTKTGRSVLQEDTAVIRGMIHHVKHLLTVEVVEDQPKARKRQVKGQPIGLSAAPAKDEAAAKPKRSRAKKSEETE
jgi:large subunit ribosomal protein L30